MHQLVHNVRNFSDGVLAVHLEPHVYKQGMLSHLIWHFGLNNAVKILIEVVSIKSGSYAQAPS